MLSERDGINTVGGLALVVFLDTGVLGLRGLRVGKSIPPGGTVYLCAAEERKITLGSTPIGLVAAFNRRGVRSFSSRACRTSAELTVVTGE